MIQTADQVDELIKQLKADHVELSDAVFTTGRACVGWPYVYGAEGQKTTKDGITVRKFDCQGFVEWCLLQFGIDIRAAGATSQWNKEEYWKAKGEVKEGVPDNILVCLFKQSDDNPKKMAHVGFGFRGSTVECSVGVQYFAKRNAKWTHWAIPKGIDGEIPEYKPTLRKGDTGEYVTLAQTELLMKGYDLGKYGVDGKFGQATENAVKDFQRDWNLKVDGIIGKQTWEYLDSTPGKTLYTVTIPHLPLYQAEGLVKSYAGAYMTEERG